MSKWPKKKPILTEEQRRISDEYMLLWQEILPERYNAIECFNHGYPVKMRGPIK